MQAGPWFEKPEKIEIITALRYAEILNAAADAQQNGIVDAVKYEDGSVGIDGHRYMIGNIVMGQYADW